jgi:hypothetical protein
MSISRNPKNNRWYVLVDVPAGPDGKRRRQGVGGFKTKREAKAAYIVPRLRDLSLQRLTTARVGAFYGELVVSGGKGGRPLSPKTVRYVHTTLRRALRDAVADGLVVRNVAAQARPPRARRVEMHTWTAAEVGVFLASVREDRLHVGWLLLATLGLRRASCWACAGRMWT